MCQTASGETVLWCRTQWSSPRPPVQRPRVCACVREMERERQCVCATHAPRQFMQPPNQPRPCPHAQQPRQRTQAERKSVRSETRSTTRRHHSGTTPQQHRNRDRHTHTHTRTHRHGGDPVDDFVRRIRRQDFGARRTDVVVHRVSHPACQQPKAGFRPPGCGVHDSHTSIGEYMTLRTGKKTKENKGASEMQRAGGHVVCGSGRDVSCR